AVVRRRRLAYRIGRTRVCVAGRQHALLESLVGFLRGTLGPRGCESLMRSRGGVSIRPAQSQVFEFVDQLRTSLPKLDCVEDLRQVTGDSGARQPASQLVEKCRVFERDVDATDRVVRFEETKKFVR